MNKTYEKYRELMQKVADVKYTLSLLHWDHETNMPQKGAAIRARQIGTLSGIAHELFISKDLEALLEKLQNDSSLSDSQAKNIFHSSKDLKREKKYPTDFVVKLNKTTAESFQTWKKAKKENEYGIFAPKLEELLNLKKEECEILGYKDHPYDAMLDQYEPEEKTANIDMLFQDVKKQLKSFFQTVKEKPQVDNSFLKKVYDKNKQWDFGIYLLKQMGYDFEAGRQDITAHPFTIHLNNKDVRVTTRINEKDFTSMTWSCIHEGGHALYEQGLKTEEYGLPMGDSISLGIHESQSRLWENHVGRSLAYWKANYDKVQKLFNENLGNISLQEFYRGINRIEPTFIRTEADELTYHFHILIRFELEKELISGNLTINDLPKAWNQKYKEYLDLDVPDVRLGVLQDIHWSYGNFGYFPTYSLGSFYAAQFFNKAQEDIGNLTSSIETGNMKPLLNWLREHIHQHGKFYSAEELCIKITGEKLNFKYFMEYAEKKFSDIYAPEMAVVS
ncbi:carboxypeptidase M32 [Candidatus Amoebophilus asiaticus]|nr:carboxypeptidase M32 [Candidatus Amoebophilus asiaticus]